MKAVILYRIDCRKRMHRYYRMDLQPDLFGQWCLMAHAQMVVENSAVLDMLSFMPATPVTPGVTQFRARRPGPEALIQDVVAGHIRQLFAPGDHSWTAASLPLGAGIPDLVIVSYHPQLLAMANVDLTGPEILAYLRAVGRAKLGTIAERTGMPRKKLSQSIGHLVEADAILPDADSYILSPLWRDILPEIITVEVKVANWQKAVSQAARNREECAKEDDSECIRSDHCIEVVRSTDIVCARRTVLARLFEYRYRRG